MALGRNTSSILAAALGLIVTGRTSILAEDDPFMPIQTGRSSGKTAGGRQITKHPALGVPYGVQKTQPVNHKGMSNRQRDLYEKALRRQARQQGN